MLVYSSTQHPIEVQHLIARSLKLSDHSVVCDMRRMGGGFGDKESQASLTRWWRHCSPRRPGDR